jgi:anion-transporting  ArsA/GET3 family ATPase
MVKKAHLITGKGGVGKSLFSVVLANYLSRKNQQVLLTELSEHSFFKDYLNLADITYKPLPLKTHLDICQWSPEECLKEYALHLLKIESLYQLFFQNPVSKSLVAIAPGLQELALLGKLTSSPRSHGPKMPYEQIVVDSYSTGHFLNLLRAPGALNQAVPFGPMGEQSKSIDTCIRNSDFTQVHLITTCEELPITESIELYNQLKSEFNIKPKVYLNKMLEISALDFSDLNAISKTNLQQIIDLQNWSRAKLEKNNIVFTELPFVASLDTNTLIENILMSLAGSDL